MTQHEKRPEPTEADARRNAAWQVFIAQYAVPATPLSAPPSVPPQAQ